MGCYNTPAPQLVCAPDCTNNKYVLYYNSVFNCSTIKVTRHIGIYVSSKLIYFRFSTCNKPYF